MLGGIIPADGGVITTLIANTSVPNTLTAVMAYGTISRPIGGITSCQMVTPMSSTQLIGSRYFKHVIITWSMRSRGNVQRIHIITKTSNQPFKMKTTTLMTLPRTHPEVP